MADIATISQHLIHAGFGLLDELPVFTSGAWEDHVQAWLDAESEVTNHRWRQAAVCASVTVHFGESSIEKFAEAVGCNWRRVYEYRAAYQLATAFARISARPENLEFSHFVVASAAPDPVAVLEEAAAESMSVRQLKRLIAEKTAPPVDSSLPAILEDPAILQVWRDWVAAGKRLAAVAPVTGRAIAYACEEVKYALELPSQSVADRIKHLISDMDLNELDPIAQTLGQHRDVVKVWLNRMVESGELLRREQKLDERAPGARGPARIFYEVA